MRYVPIASLLSTFDLLASDLLNKLQDNVLTKLDISRKCHCIDLVIVLLAWGFVFYVPGTGKSHQNTSAGKFDPERAVWNC